MEIKNFNTYMPPEAGRATAINKSADETSGVSSFGHTGHKEDQRLSKQLLLRAEQQRPEAAQGRDSEKVEFTKEAQKHQRSNNKAFFALDENDNVVIKVVDDKNELVKQIPPEDYLKVVNKLEENREHLFHKEV